MNHTLVYSDYQQKRNQLLVEQVQRLLQETKYDAIYMLGETFGFPDHLSFDSIPVKRVQDVSSGLSELMWTQTQFVTGSKDINIPFRTLYECMPHLMVIIPNFDKQITISKAFRNVFFVARHYKVTFVLASSRFAMDPAVRSNISRFVLDRPERFVFAKFYFSSRYLNEYAKSIVTVSIQSDGTTEVIQHQPCTTLDQQCSD